MPTILSHHPTLSLMIVFAVYVAFWLHQKNLYYKIIVERKLFLVGGIFLFIFLHVFSVRSGLLAMYLVIFVELGKLIFQKKQFKTAVLFALIIFIVGGITLLVSPTVSNKIANTTQDLQNYENNGSANNQSLGSRMISYKNGIRIAKESNVFWGCGLGDISDLNDEIFKKDYPEVTKIIIPHNQFLYYFGAIGIIGVVIFAFCFYFPLFYKKAFYDPLLTTHMLIITVGFQFESPLQSQIGVAYSLIFILLPLHQKFGSKALKRF
jgi:O-antigen ligase